MRWPETVAEVKALDWYWWGQENDRAHVLLNELYIQIDLERWYPKRGEATAYLWTRRGSRLRVSATGGRWVCVLYLLEAVRKLRGEL